MANKLREQISNFVINWNNRFPIDYWWRKKYNIPFNSEKHRQANFIQMFYEYEEEREMKKLFDKISKEEEDKDINDITGSNMTKEEIDEDFENLDIGSY